MDNENDHQPSSGAKSRSNLLQSRQCMDILDVIDQLRSFGISHYVDLPEIIVCGDQSSGKSSVLNAVSGIQFPQKDSLCTRFATEVILRRAVSENVSVSIVPDSSRAEDEQRKIISYSKSNVDMENIEQVIAEATDVIGIDHETRNFSHDILRFEVTGKNQPQLTLVDLPGLFVAGNKSQSDEDATAVKNLVLDYMSRSRSIILAVVSARNDFGNQIVTKYAREVDPEGNRTLGIITKPDTLPEGSESEAAFIELAQNRDVILRRGWHVLRNRNFETRQSTQEQRDAVERVFFAQGVWSQLARTCVGVHTLRERLSVVLRDQITQEIPSLIREIEKGSDSCRMDLRRLGPPRAEVEDQRRYLLQASHTFSTLMKSAVDGTYNGTFFGDAMTLESAGRRLRALLQNILLRFSTQMRRNGHARHIERRVTKDQQKANPRLVSQEDFVSEVVELMRRSRGRELPGTFNPQIIQHLFHQQSYPWRSLCNDCIAEIEATVQAFVDTLLRHTMDETTSHRLYNRVIGPQLEQLCKSLEEMTDKILVMHEQNHPITYNHYFTDNVQKAKIDHQREDLARKLDRYFGTNVLCGNHIRDNVNVDVRQLLGALTRQTEVDMDRYACSEAIDCMRAYYKVAMKTVVDNLSQLAVEECLIQRLPDILSPTTVAMISDDAVQKIATEGTESMHERSTAKKKLMTLQDALELLGRSQHGSKNSSVSGNVARGFYGTGRITSQEHESKTSDEEVQQRSSCEHYGHAETAEIACASDESLDFFWPTTSCEAAAFDSNLAVNSEPNTTTSKKSKKNKAVKKNAGVLPD